MRLRGDAGQVAGLEALVFGLLVFVVGILAFAELWALVDAKIATVDAATEAARAFVQAQGPVDATAAATSAARASVAVRGDDASRTTVAITGQLRRCSAVTVDVAYVVPLIRLPFIDVGGRLVTVHGHHRELVDAYRSGLNGAGGCA